MQFSFSFSSLSSKKSYAQTHGLSQVQYQKPRKSSTRFSLLLEQREAIKSSHNGIRMFIASTISVYVGWKWKIFTMLQRAIFLCMWTSFSFRYIFFPSFRKEKQGREWIGKVAARKKYSCSCVLEWWKEREKLCVNVECSIACDVYIMAFYSAGKIDSMIEQFSFFSPPNTHSTLFAYKYLIWVRACVCMRELENLILNDCCKNFVDPEFSDF